MAKTKSRKSTPASQAAIRAKKRAASILRKQGLYKTKVPRITNEVVRKSGALQRKLREFSNVVRGEAKAHKVGKRRVVVPIQPGIQTYVRSGRVIQRPAPAPSAAAPSSTGAPSQSAAEREARRQRIRDIARKTKPEQNDRREGGEISRAQWIREVTKIADQYPAQFDRLTDRIAHKRQTYRSAARYDWGEDPADDWEVFYEYEELFYYHES